MDHHISGVGLISDVPFSKGFFVNMTKTNVVFKTLGKLFVVA